MSEAAATLSYVVALWRCRSTWQSRPPPNRKERRGEAAGQRVALRAVRQQPGRSHP